LAQKEVLTDRRLKSLKSAPTGKRYIVWDAMAPHLGVRVTDKGSKSFVIVKRRTGGARPVYHIVGAYPATKLKDAREAVPTVLRTFADGNLPKEVKQQEAREAARRRADTFETAVEKFIEWEKGRNLRSAHATATVLRREFLGLRPKRSKVASKRGDGQATEWVTEWTEGKDPVWRLRPIKEITRHDAIERLEEIKKRGGKYAARHALGAVRKLFNWAEEGERFGVMQSPAARIRDKTIGISKPWERMLAQRLRDLREITILTGTTDACDDSIPREPRVIGPSY